MMNGADTPFLRSLLCGMVVIGVVGLSPFAQAQHPDLSPQEVVALWLKVYPGKLEKAADLTTLAFRQGGFKEDWVVTQKPLLQGLQMRYIKTRILGEEIRAPYARVLVHARLSTWMGAQEVDEQYLLLRGSDGSWLVDRIDEYRPQNK
jgi:hypothetical protein